MPAHRIGVVPTIPAERQARHRAKLRQPGQAFVVDDPHHPDFACLLLPGEIDILPRMEILQYIEIVCILCGNLNTGSCD
jgi:hypothetical protein